MIQKLHLHRLHLPATDQCVVDSFGSLQEAGCFFPTVGGQAQSVDWARSKPPFEDLENEETVYSAALVP